MNPGELNNIIEQVLGFIRTTGETLVTAGFQIAYRKAIADGVVFTFFGILFFILLIVSLTKLLHFIRKFKEYERNGEENYAVTAGMLFGILSFISLVVTSIYLPDGIQHLIVPEWYAITNIINLVK